MPKKTKVEEVLTPAETAMQAECKHQNQGEGKCLDCGINV